MTDEFEAKLLVLPWGGSWWRQTMVVTHFWDRSAKNPTRQTLSVWQKTHGGYHMKKSKALGSQEAYSNGALLRMVSLPMTELDYSVDRVSLHVVLTDSLTLTGLDWFHIPIIPAPRVYLPFCILEATVTKYLTSFPLRAYTLFLHCWGLIPIQFSISWVRCVHGQAYFPQCARDPQSAGLSTLSVFDLSPNPATQISLHHVPGG